MKLYEIKQRSANELIQIARNVGAKLFGSNLTGRSGLIFHQTS